jgi:hypothetical protein
MRGSSGSTDAAPSPRAARRLDRRLAELAYLLDQAFRIPGTRWRVGLDPIVGLLFPGGGDALGAAVSAVTVLVAVRHGVPGVVVARMVFNIAVDLVVGLVPVAGDVFDVAWKANTRNLRLLETHMGGARRPGWREWLWVWLLLAGLAALAVGAVVLATLALRALGVRLV